MTIDQIALFIILPFIGGAVITILLFHFRTQR